MSIVATVPVADMEAANAALEALGHGPGNFSVAEREGTDGATHAGLHCFDYGPFYIAITTVAATITSIEITYEEGVKPELYRQHCDARGLEGYDPTTWVFDPVMTGDVRTYGGKTWESTIDYNVWLPPVGYREIGVEWPEFQKPSGAHDAYSIGDKITFEGLHYTSLMDGNVWSPAEYPAGWQLEAA